MTTESLDNSDYLSLSTQKKDGSWVDTPVWFAKENKTALFEELTK